jgi:hypothetical protein
MVSAEVCCLAFHAILLVASRPDCRIPSESPECRRSIRQDLIWRDVAHIIFLGLLDDPLSQPAPSIVGPPPILDKENLNRADGDSVETDQQHSGDCEPEPDGPGGFPNSVVAIQGASQDYYEDQSGHILNLRPLAQQDNSPEEPRN